MYRPSHLFLVCRPAQWLAVLLVLAVPEARAQDAPDGSARLCQGPKPGLPRAPFLLKLQFNVGREHGCSQSMESLGEVGTLELSVDDQGGAALKLDLFHAYTFGPSRGRFKQGAHDFVHNDTRFWGRWKGKVQASSEALVVRFTAQAVSHELWGSEFHPEKNLPSDLTITCKPAAVTLEPPVTLEKIDGGMDSQLECSPVLLCRTSESILTFDDEEVRRLSGRLFIDGQLPMAPGLGLEADIRFFYHGTWDHLRRGKD